MATTQDAFRKAEAAELLAAEIYRALANLFAWDLEGAALFRRLEQEEQQHAARVRLLAARLRQDRRLLQDVDVDTGVLDALVAESRALLADIVEGRWTFGIERTKQAAAEFEDRLAHAHAEMIARGAHPVVREFFETLAQQDAAHLELIRLEFEPGE